MTLDARTRTAVESAFGYTFKDQRLVEQALTHRSLISEHRATVSNEPLEFLGDAILGFVVAEMLHRRDPGGAEGEKTLIRARLVSTTSLVRIGRTFDIASLIRMSAAHEKNGGRLHDRVQEDAVEALVAAVYLDGGIGAARRAIGRLIAPALEEASLATTNSKGALQELLHARGWQLASYETDRDEGTEHRPRWRSNCLVDGEILGRGEGSTRKKAELAAADQALGALKARDAIE